MSGPPSPDRGAASALASGLHDVPCRVPGGLPVKNFEIARLFGLMADLLEVQGANPFRIRAYRRAAQNLESLGEDVEVLAREGRLDDIPGIGEDLAAKIGEYLQTGRIAALEHLRRAVPRGMADLMAVPGIGPKTAKLLYEKAGATTLDRLEALARAGKLRGLPGIRAKTEANILEGLALVRAGQARMLLGRVLPLAEEFARAIGGLPGVSRVEVAGSARRRKETVGDLDLLVIAEEGAATMAGIAALPQVADVLELGSTRASFRHREGFQVDVRVVPPESFGAALLYFTGSKAHNIRLRELAGRKGFKLSEYGLFRLTTGRRVAGATEADVYGALGLPYIPPEIREDTGEVEEALAGRLPTLVDLPDIRGDLHAHTRASDGHHTVDALVAAARARGYAYVAVTDHSRSARVAGGLSTTELRAHVRRIRDAGRRFPGIRVLAGSECDILPDGRLDYPDEILDGLDIVVAAVHTRLGQDEREMTRRVCRALETGRVDVLAHPTGRLIGERSPSALDLDEVLRVATRAGVAVEVNAHPQRLDLNDVHARRARDLGALLALDTDAHVLDQLEGMRLAVGTARRGWVEPDRVVNTWPLARLEAWLARSRGGTRRPGRRPAA